jgi:N-sulfoglucosamine sulfohydrolase
MYGKRTIAAFTQRPRFELYDLERDPQELRNLAGDLQYREVFAKLQHKLRDFQRRTGDPWELKWERE